MTKKINLKKILSKYPTFTNEGGYGEYYVIEAMKEACQETLRLASENAEIKEIFTEDYYSKTYIGNNHHAIHTDGDGEAFALTEFVIDKQSILDTINQIE